MTITEIEETLSQMDTETIEQETENYKNKLTSVGEKFHHKAKLATLIHQWKEYEARTPAKAASTNDLRKQMRDEHLALIRVRITNHNPSKKGLTGEIFTCGNSVLGFIKKYIPYNCEAANAYHIPKFMYETLKARKFVQRSSKTVTKGGMKQMVAVINEVPEFSFEVLPPLTQAELDYMKKKQAMAKGVEID